MAISQQYGGDHIVYTGGNAALPPIPAFLQLDANLRAGLPFGASYAASAVGFAGYATPTDLVTISGAAGKIIAISNFAFTMNATSATIFTVHFIRRSTANTGGTSTSPTPVKYDSTAAAASAVVKVYTAAPTLGDAAGTLRVHISSVTAATAQAGKADLSNSFNIPARSNIAGPIILRGAAESLCVNGAAAAIPAGFTAGYHIEWIEYDA